MLLGEYISVNNNNHNNTFEFKGYSGNILDLLLSTNPLKDKKQCSSLSSF